MPTHRTNRPARVPPAHPSPIPQASSALHQAVQIAPNTPLSLVRLAVPLVLAALLVPLTGCAGFFVKPTTTTTPTAPTGPVTNTTGDYAYVANSSLGSTALSAYNVGAGTLASIGNYTLGYVPVALNVAPANSFLYVASAPGATSPGVYLYNIAPSSGSLTSGNSGTALAIDTVAAMAISPDGNWLFTVNIDGITMNEYKVDTTTGALTLSSNIGLPGTSCVPVSASPASQSCSVTVSPGGTYVVASLGTAGDVVFPYTAAAGITGTGASSIPSGFSATDPTGDFSAVLDTNNYVYIARSSSIGVYSLGSTNTNTGNVTYTTSPVPRGITLNKTGSNLFTANEGTGTISSFGITGAGALNAAVGSPFTASAHVSALGVDNTGIYMVAVGYDASTGVQLYSISSTGVLTQVAAAASGTNLVYPALVAMTH